MSATCKSCNAPLLWGRDRKSGRPIPLDATPHPEGQLWLDFSGEADLVGTVRFVSEEPPPAGRPRYVSHFATCPHAARHRRPR